MPKNAKGKNIHQINNIKARIKRHNKEDFKFNDCKVIFDKPIDTFTNNRNVIKINHEKVQYKINNENWKSYQWASYDGWSELKIKNEYTNKKIK